MKLINLLKTLMPLSAILIILCGATAIRSQVTAPNNSAAVSLVTVPVSLGEKAVQTLTADDCSTALETANQRLNKTLDALEKAEKALGFAVNEIEARKRLDALKDQLIAVKDIIIQSQDVLIKRLSNKDKGFMANLKKILEKAILIVAAISIGRGL